MANRLDRIKKRVAASTPGPWKANPKIPYITGPQVVVAKTGDGTTKSECWDTSGPRWMADARFIAASRTDLPWALDWMTRVRARIFMYPRLRDELFDDLLAELEGEDNGE